MDLKLRPVFAGACAILFAGASLALVSGCKNTTSAAMMEKHVTPPPQVTVFPTSHDPRNADPFTAPVWTGAAWYPLAAPSDTTNTTSPAQAAILYDARNLYVAFISNTVPPPSAPVAQDVVSVYLDSTPQSNGQEVAKISVTSTGTLDCDWIRTELPAQAKADGSPDWFHPYRQIPNIQVSGLSAKTFKTVQNGSVVWAAVVAIPLGSLPASLHQEPAPGVQWKINLLRTVTTRDVGSGPQQLQSNLSSVYVGAQAVSPYRMATLVLAPAPKR